MNQYLFLFYNKDSSIIGWDYFDPKEPVSEAMAVQQCFNLLYAEMFYARADVYSYRHATLKCHICTLVKR